MMLIYALCVCDDAQKEQAEAAQAAAATALLVQDDAPQVNICPPSPQNNRLDPKTGNFTP